MSQHIKKAVPARAAKRRAARPSFDLATPEVTFENAAELLGDRMYFHPIHAHITGDTRAALMLERVVYWTKIKLRTDPRSNGWFYKSQLEWFLETGLTKEEQRTSSRTLKAIKLIEIEKRGWPATNHFLLDREQYVAQLSRYLPSAKVVGKAHHKSLAKPPVIQHIIPHSRKSFSVNTELSGFTWPTEEENDTLAQLYEKCGAHSQMQLQHRFFAETDAAKNAGVATDDWLQMKWTQILMQHFSPAEKRGLQPTNRRARK